MKTIKSLCLLGAALSLSACISFSKSNTRPNTVAANRSDNVPLFIHYTVEKSSRYYNLDQPSRKRAAKPEGLGRSVLDLEKKVRDYDIDLQLSYHLNAAFRASKPFVSASILNTRNMTSDPSLQLMNISEAALLSLECKYAFSDDFSSVQFVTNAQLYLSERAKVPGNKPVYSKFPAYSTTVVHSANLRGTKNAQEAIDKWLARAKLQRGLDKIINDTANQLSKELNGKKLEL